MRHRTDHPRSSGRVVAALAATTTLLIALAAPAHAEDPPSPAPGSPELINPVPITPACPDTSGGGSSIDDLGGSVLGTCWGNDAAGPGRDVSSGLVWQWYGCDRWLPFSPGSMVSKVAPQGELILEDIVARNLDPTVTYFWHTVECTHVQVGAAADGSDIIQTWGWGLLVIGTTVPVDPTVLRDAAAARIDPQPPTAASSPMWSEVPALVNLPTWLWIADEWEPIEEQESQGFVTVVVQARPVETVWTLGDGTTVHCPNGPGVEWSPGLDDSQTYCSHTFESSATGLSGDATLHWTFRWWLNGNDMGDFGTFTRETPLTFDVVEIQAIETSD